jgi:hypothetical protein
MAYPELNPKVIPIAVTTNPIAKGATLPEGAIFRTSVIAKMSRTSKAVPTI